MFYVKKNTCLIFILLLSLCLKSFAQNTVPFNYSPLPPNSYTYRPLNAYKLYLDSIAEKNTEHVNKTIQKDYKGIIAGKNTDLIKELNENNFLFDDKINPYLSSVFYSIANKNNLDKSLFHFFTNRSFLVNAYSYEDGTIVCNLGLLNIAETESQVAMVFCHEIAHYLLSHSNNSIIAQLEKFNSAEFRSQVKAIKRETYHTKSKLEGLLMEDVFNRRKHNRVQELSADSLGMELFIKTGYSSSSIPHLYDLLEGSQDNDSIYPIQSFFKKENISVDENWFTTDKKMSFGTPTAKEIIDSLKTHPDCSKRKAFAQVFFSNHIAGRYDFITGNKETLQTIKQHALFEEANFEKDRKNMSLYFFQLLQNSVQFPGNKYIVTEIFNTFLSFTINQKNHSLYTIIDKPYSTQDDTDEYAKLLKMLDKISLKQLADVTISYYQKNKEFINTNTETISIFNQIKGL